MATIQMVNRLQERQGFRLASVLRDEADVSAVAWWADGHDDEPQLLIGFDAYRAVGPRACIDRVADALTKMPLGDAVSLLSTRSVASDDPRLEALAAHPWETSIPLDDPDLTYRFVNVWSRSTGSSQALVYFLRAGDEVRVPLPPALSQVA